MRGHRMTLTNRGPNHRHPWHVECSCGWGHGTTATAFRVKASAKQHWKDHAEMRRMARSAGGGEIRPVTPDDKLPEGLRRSL